MALFMAPTSLTLKFAFLRETDVKALVYTLITPTALTLNAA